MAASEALDRGLSQPRWGDDGTNIFAIVTDDMSAYGVRIPIGTGSAVAITDKPIEPGENERRMNPRSRSAKLRVAEKIG